MLHKARSKDDYGRNTSSMMSKAQMTDYLQDLRSNPPMRPQGSRPAPPSMKRRSYNFENSQLPQAPSNTDMEFKDPPSRSSSAMSHHRHSYSLSGRASPDKFTYAERDQRRREREEARLMRMAMGNLDEANDSSLIDAARDEANDLIQRHKYPDAPYHVSRGSRTSLTSRYRHSTDQLGDYGELLDHYTTNRGSIDSSQLSLSNIETSAPGDSREPSPTLEDLEKDMSEIALTAVVEERPQEDTKGGRRISQRLSMSGLTSRRRSSGILRRSTSDINSMNAHKKPFPNKEDQIYVDPQHRNEEPVVRPTVVASANDTTPSWVQRNPFARAQQARQSLTRRISQIGSRVPEHTSENSRTSSATNGKDTDSNTKYKHGLEVRGEDIRAATSMKLSDRSPRLPSPTVVSDRPDRPIVSFSQDWQASQTDSFGHQHGPHGDEKACANGNAGKIERPMQKASNERAANARSHHVRQTSGWRDDMQPIPVGGSCPPAEDPEVTPRPSRTSVSRVKALNHSQQGRPDQARSSAMTSNDTFSNRVEALPAIPAIHFPDDADIPTGVSKGGNKSQPARSNFSNPSVPSITFTQEPAVRDDARTIPTINLPGQEEETHVLPPSVGTHRRHQVNGMRKQANHNLPQRRDAYGPAHGSSWIQGAQKQAILCAQCALPISGKIVSAAGTRFHPGCFTCYHCNEALECVAFLPEPADKRAARLHRIDRRLAGETVEPPVGYSIDQDNDDSLRFFCHLDFHEFFSPRCKNCKTPIEGEVVVACGAHWHVGHFFCAQCGDPFDPATPFVEKDGYAWCVNCHTNRTSSRCKKCRKPVTDTVLTALGAEWHESCFTCVECSSPFANGQYFLRGNCEDPVCFDCESRRLKA